MTETDKNVWLITGTGRGMGTDIAKAALAAGHAVVATGRDPERVAAAVGQHDDLAVVKLDVTSVEDAKAATQAAVDRFGKIDVLVNNAGNFYAGFFEEITPDDFRAQVETNLFGPLNVARAVLPVMRKQRSGLVVAISSTGGIIGQEFCTAYSAAKFGIEGWIESLAPEVAPFGIRTMVVEPGFFRTDLLTAESTKYAEASIDDYAERTKQTVTSWNSMNGKQGGDPAKLAAALVKLASQEKPPVRWVAGADAVQTVEQKGKDLIAQADAYRGLFFSVTRQRLIRVSHRVTPNTAPTHYSSANRAGDTPAYLSGSVVPQALRLFASCFRRNPLPVLCRVMRDSRPPADLRHIERSTRHDGPLRWSARLKPPGKSVPRLGVQSLSSPSNPMSQWRP
jgi:NAD(P)-dependent dehydrogenase (short-subunit alcohol dehydrogenase family)